EPVARFLAQNREAGLPAVFAWARRLVDLVAAGERYSVDQVLAQLVDLFVAVEDDPALLELSAHLLSKLDRAKVAKTEDPRPRAIEHLLRRPAIALPVVQAARNQGWARRLLPQLKRASGTAERLPVAPEGELPPQLQK